MESFNGIQLTRKELQCKAKELGVKANQKTALLVAAIAAALAEPHSPVSKTPSVAVDTVEVEDELVVGVAAATRRRSERFSGIVSLSVSSPGPLQPAVAPAAPALPHQPAASGKENRNKSAKKPWTMKPFVPLKSVKPPTKPGQFKTVNQPGTATSISSLSSLKAANRARAQAVAKEQVC